ncbi:hypothetical protein C8Q76DRAFT_603626, partial [Earliella scabrosa]
VLVKFTPTYCGAAHQLLAASNYAPALLYCGPLYGDDVPVPARMQAVVMEIVPHGEVEWPYTTEETCQMIRAAVNLLHEHGMVHGDLRPQNVFMDVTAKAVRIIDFDWAGKEGEARYPGDLSPRVQWPPGARPGGLITRAHDLYWLDKVFASLR